MLLKEISEDIVVYHGSKYDFDQFDVSKIGDETENLKGGWGVYLTTDRSVAANYSTGKGTVKAYKIPSHRRYFNLDEGVDDSDQIYAKLESLNLVSDDDLEEFKNEFVDEQYRFDTTNQQMYDWLSHVLGSNKNASMFLYDEMGYIGNTFSDKTNPNAQNFVLFDAKYITSHLE